MRANFFVEPMKIASVNISGFRGITKIEIPSLDEHSNLFVGINGAGKSSVLDAISYLLSYFVKRMTSRNLFGGKLISDDDISLLSKDGTTLSLTLDNGLSWQLYRSKSFNKSNKTNLSALNDYIFYLRNKIENEPQTNIPVIAHYKVKRAVDRINVAPSKKKNKTSVLDAYNGALDGNTSFADFFTWYREQEDIENEKIRDERDFRDNGLQAIRKAVMSIFPEYTEMRVQRSPRALVIKKNDNLLKLNQLSDGEKCYITLVCDLTRRLAIANPSQDPLQGEGIVLIDEFDLHLHPQWQLSVITKLTKTFPNCQFIFTTHSPIVASDTKGKVFGLENGQLTPLHTFGRKSDTILSEAFNVPYPRNQYIQDLITTAYKAIHSNNHSLYEKTMNELLGYDIDSADLAKIKLEKVRWEKNNQ